MNVIDGLKIPRSTTVNGQRGSQLSLQQEHCSDVTDD
jgi:hypothetical protein